MARETVYDYGRIGSAESAVRVSKRRDGRWNVAYYLPAGEDIPGPARAEIAETEEEAKAIEAKYDAILRRRGYVLRAPKAEGVR